MKRRAAFGLLFVAALASVLVATPSAQSAVRDVKVGNFYFDDASPGDGIVEALQGDQLRFTVLDGGPGTPHTVEIDELGIHSGSLAAGETFTTPPLNRAGTYSLYCKPHQNRGHKATLVIREATAPTSAPATSQPAPPPTTTPRTGQTNTTSPATSAPASAGSAGSTSTTAPGTSAPANDETPGAANGPVDSTATTLAPVGRGEADDATLATAPVEPGSLQTIIGRPPGRKGAWTRSVRFGFILLVPMSLLAAGALIRGRRSRPS